MRVDVVIISSLTMINKYQHKPLFQRRHYEAIAAIIAKQHGPYQKPDLDMINDLTVMFIKDNPNFSAERFLKACYKGTI